MNSYFPQHKPMPIFDNAQPCQWRGYVINLRTGREYPTRVYTAASFAKWSAELKAQRLGLIANDYRITAVPVSA
jgi:hypothetical protein